MTRFIQNYDNEIPCYDSAKLREQLSMLRWSMCDRVGDEISDEPWKVWRMNAGLTKTVGGKVKPNRLKTLTKRQAALIVMQGLWKPRGGRGVKSVINSDVALKELNKVNVTRLFDEWVRTSGGVEAGKLLDEIYTTKESLTGKELSILSAVLLGKKIDVTTLRNWLRPTRESLKSDEMWSRKAVLTVLNRVVSLASQEKSSAS